LDDRAPEDDRWEDHGRKIDVCPRKEISIKSNNPDTKYQAFLTDKGGYLKLKFIQLNNPILNIAISFFAD